MNRTQAVVLAFFAAAWVSLVVIVAVAPEIYDAVLHPPPEYAGGVDLVFLLGISALIAFVSLGTIRRWRWTFWLLLLAMLAGVLRAPASLLELTGVLPPQGPTWYALFQAAIGVTQFVIGLLMLRGFRRAGIWGRF